MNGLNYNFTLPTVKKYGKNGKKDWRIEYRFNGIRVQIKVNKVRQQFATDREAEKYLKEYIIFLTDNLNNGNNPFAKESKTVVLLSDLLDSYYIYYESCKPLESNDNGTSCKRLKSYVTCIDLIKDFIKKSNPTDYRITDYTVASAQNFVNQLQKYYNWSDATFSRYLRVLKNAFTFAVGAKYCKDNPFDCVKKISGLRKENRRNVTTEEWHKIATNLAQNNYNFYIFCNVVKHLARPNEILRIQKKHVNVDDMSILLPAENTKTKKTRTIFINKSFLSEFREYLMRIDFANLNDNIYLFGKGFIPSLDTMNSCTVSQNWRSVCDSLGLPKDCELYGLRHAGITEMANSGVPLNVIRLQAGHSTTIMTSHYANHISEEAVNTLRNWK